MKKGYVDLPEGQVHYRTEGDGEPLLLFHQAPLSSLEYSDVIPMLSHRFRVIAPDMMGHGDSDDPTHELSLDEFAASAVRFMDKLGITRAALGGNHSGSALALCVAVTEPARVTKLIISGESYTPKSEIMAFLENLKKRPMSRDLPMDEGGQFLVSAWERYKALAPKSAAQVRFKPFVVGLMARQRPFDAHYRVFEWMARDNYLPKVKCPTLLFSGTEDLFFNRARLEEARRFIPDCQLAIIENAGAMIMFEKPKEVAEVFLKFLTTPPR